jgi:hypothetical protein
VRDLRGLGGAAAPLPPLGRGGTATSGSQGPLSSGPAEPGRLYRMFILFLDVLGPVPGVDVMAKGPQGWMQCEDHLPYYKDNPCSLPRLHDHDSTTREDPGGGARGPGPARVGLLGASMQREGAAVPDSSDQNQNKMTRIAS